MKGRKQSEKIVERGKEVFVWIDVHKERWQVTIRAEGEEVFHGHIASGLQVSRDSAKLPLSPIKQGSERPPIPSCLIPLEIR